MSDTTSRASTSPLYLVATDDGSTDTHLPVREAGLRAAESDGARVVLFDRTSESTMTDPYPVGAWSPEDDAVSPTSQLDPETLEGLGRTYLADQLREARGRGLEVDAFLGEGTGAQSVQEAVERFQPTLVFLPESMDHQGLVGKLRGDTLEKVEERTDAELRLVDTDGSTRTV